MVKSPEIIARSLKPERSYLGVAWDGFSHQARANVLNSAKDYAVSNALLKKDRFGKSFWAAQGETVASSLYLSVLAIPLGVGASLLFHSDIEMGLKAAGAIVAFGGGLSEGGHGINAFTRRLANFAKRRNK